MSEQEKKAGRVDLEAVLAEFTKSAGIKGAAEVTRDNPDGSDHPAAKPPENNIVNPPEGERGKENDSDVESNIVGSINDPAPPAKSEEGSDAVEFLNAPTTLTGEDPQSYKDHVQDPGTESAADVSVEKTAAEIAARVKKEGRAKVAVELGAQSLDFLNKALAPASQSAKTKAAAAGAAQAAQDAIPAEFSALVKQASVEAANDALVAATVLGQWWAKQAEDGGEEAAAEEAALAEEAAAAEGGEEAAAEELAAAGDMGGELDPEGLAELLAIAEGEGGPPVGGDDEAALLLSQILDEAGITPEEAMGLEANAAALDPSMAPEAKMAHLRKVAYGLNAVSAVRPRDPSKAYQKRAAVIHRDHVYRGVQEYIAKAAYIAKRRQEIAAARR